jgi:hypothetical protein
MLRNALSASFLAAMALATPALADDVTVETPIEGAVLHQGRLDMVVYYVQAHGDLLEVTATFAPKGGGEAQHVDMALADGDSVAFAIPGHQDTLYAFSRDGAAVTVSSETAASLQPAPRIY